MLATDLKPPPLDVDRCALFLDLDGTLAEIAPRPEQIGPLDERTRLLRALVGRMQGRVAVLTGRTLNDADRILEGAVAPVAAVHGLALRMPDGAVVSFLPSRALSQARSALQSLAENRPGLLIEDKGASLAVHYRGAPDAEPEVRRTTAQLAQTLDLALQNGSMVCELRTPGPHKGDALRTLLSQPPMAGFTPVMVGDDLTDEHGFAAADDLGGYGVLVGPPRTTRARYRLGSVREVFDWLGGEARS